MPSFRTAPIATDAPLPEDLWKPRRWLDPPERRPEGGFGPVVAILAVVVGYNVLANTVLPAWAYVPSNVVVGAVLLWLAFRAGATWDLMGLRVDRLGRGLVVGLIVAAVIGAGVLIAVVLPFARDYFADERFEGVSVGQALYQMVVRIPLGTAAFEEFVFRGVLLGVFLRWLSPLLAASASSLVFGFWHILPTIDTLETNPAGEYTESAFALAGALAGAVIFTGAVGYGFTWLRFRGNSLVTPTLAHIATNSFGYLAGWLVVRWGLS